MKTYNFLGDSCCNPLSLGRIIKVLQKSLGNDSHINSLRIGKSFVEVLYRFTMNSMCFFAIHLFTTYFKVLFLLFYYKIGCEE